MRYDLPTVNVFETRPRLGEAAVTLKEWSGVIRAAGDRSCLRIAVHAQGRAGELQLDIQ